MRPRGLTAVGSLARRVSQIDVSVASDVATMGSCVGRRYRLEARLEGAEGRACADDCDRTGSSGRVRNIWAGDGSTGSVWRARHISGDLCVAIKLLDPAIAKDEELLEGFFSEVRAAAALSSEHVIEILDWGVERDTPYFVMELLAGETLERRLVQRTLSLMALRRIFAEVSHALEEAHGLGVVHRDLKPSKLFMMEAGGSEKTKLLFGIAKIMNDTLDLVRRMANHPVAPVDSVAYMSPEQVLGKSTLDHRSDLWSLAVIAYECMTGRLPFPGVTLGERLVRICTAAPVLPSDVCAVPPGFDAWFMRAVHKLPAERFGSALEMSSALGRVIVNAGG
jgi:eukaryotic-like serine/threonine-protein kinase